MFEDARSFGEDTIISADICIVGAGAAGITLALELMEKGLSVCVLESGGLEYEVAPQTLSEGEIIGLSYTALENTRLRMLGGSTQHWSGW